MSELRPGDVDGAFRESLDRLDEPSLRDTFEEQDCLLMVEDFVPKAVLDQLIVDVECVRPTIHRNYVPGQKKGGAVSRRNLDNLAPLFRSIYSSEPLWRFAEKITGEVLYPCRASDPHTYALYFYSEPGDRIGWHYDTSFYHGRRFTMLFCLAGNESEKVRRTFCLQAGTMVVFDGDRLWHRATPKADGDRERVLLTMEFVTDPTMSPLRRLVSDVKDACAYFGLREVFASTRLADRRE